MIYRDMKILISPIHNTDIAISVQSNLLAIAIVLSSEVAT